MAKSGKVLTTISTKVSHPNGDILLESSIKSIPKSSNFYIDFSHACYPFDGAALYVSTSYSHPSSINEAKAKISAYAKVLERSYKIEEF